MDVCRALHDSGGAGALTLVVADQQTAGRGRAGHAWFSPPGGNGYLSLLAYPAAAPRDLSKLTMLGALAVRDAVIDCHPGLAGRVTLKWFNDVLLDGKKLAGVLLESAITDGAVDFAVLGVGLNINADFDLAPDDVRSRAISLRQALGAEADREAVLHAVADALERRYAQFLCSPGHIAAEYAALVETLGKTVRIRQDDAWIEGRALRVEHDGALVVKTAAGERRIVAGEILAPP